MPFLEARLGISDLGIGQTEIPAGGHVVEARHLTDGGVHHADLDRARRIGAVAHVGEDGQEIVDLRGSGLGHLCQCCRGQPLGVHQGQHAGQRKRRA